MKQYLLLMIVISTCSLIVAMDQSFMDQELAQFERFMIEQQNMIDNIEQQNIIANKKILEQQEQQEQQKMQDFITAHPKYPLHAALYNKNTVEGNSMFTYIINNMDADTLEKLGIGERDDHNNTVLSLLIKNNNEKGLRTLFTKFYFLNKNIQRKILETLTKETIPFSSLINNTTLNSKLITMLLSNIMYFHITADHINKMTYYMVAHPTHNFFWVTDQEGNLLGYAYVTFSNSKSAYLSVLHITQNARQYGIGKQLLMYIGKSMHEQGIKTLNGNAGSFDLRENEQRSTMQPKLEQFYRSAGAISGAQDSAEMNIDLTKWYGNPPETSRVVIGRVYKLGQNTIPLNTTPNPKPTNLRGRL